MTQLGHRNPSTKISRVIAGIEADIASMTVTMTEEDISWMVANSRLPEALDYAFSETHPIVICSGLGDPDGNYVGYVIVSVHGRNSRSVAMACELVDFQRDVRRASRVDAGWGLRSGNRLALPHFNRLTGPAEADGDRLGNWAT